MKIAQLTRIYGFSAAHRLESPHLDAAENRALYRDCNNPDGHGHNYLLEVTVKGAVAPGTGMIVDLGLLDALVEDRVLRRLDHHFIGAPGPEEAGFISSAEVIARQIWSWLAGGLPAGVALARVQLGETVANRCETAGEDEEHFAAIAGRA